MRLIVRSIRALIE